MAVAASNPVLLSTEAQWLFSDADLRFTPSVLDGMSLETEHTQRSKGVNFITQVGILLKLPQLTLCTASVYMHRFFMRYSMVDLPHRPGRHPYPIAATALFLATKVEENCRKMKELIVACCRVALKQPNVVVDEQSKEFWKWRDTILHNEDVLLEALCFDLQLEQPYRLLYEFICHFGVQEDKRLRNCGWAFVNDSTFTVLCVQFGARTIAAAALYAGAKHVGVGFADDGGGRAWWEQIGVELGEVRRACNRMAEIYESYPLPKPGQKYSPVDGAELRRANRQNGHENGVTSSFTAAAGKLDLAAEREAEDPEGTDREGTDREAGEIEEGEHPESIQSTASIPSIPTSITSRVPASYRRREASSEQ